MHFDSVSFSTVVSTLCPKVKPKAPKIIDLPAPVSPVIEEKPLSNETSNLLISA